MVHSENLRRTTTSRGRGTSSASSSYDSSTSSQERIAFLNAVLSLYNLLIRSGHSRASGWRNGDSNSCHVSKGEGSVCLTGLLDQRSRNPKDLTILIQKLFLSCYLQLYWITAKKGVQGKINRNRYSKVSKEGSRKNLCVEVVKLISIHLVS